MEKLPEILKITRQILPYVKKKYKVDTLEVFGSYTRKEEKLDSDLDILVTFTETPSLIKFIELENYLSDNLHLKIDLVMKDALKPALRKRILQEAVSV